MPEAKTTPGFFPWGFKQKLGTTRKNGNHQKKNGNPRKSWESKKKVGKRQKKVGNGTGAGTGTGSGTGSGTGTGSGAGSGAGTGTGAGAGTGTGTGTGAGTGAGSGAKFRPKLESPRKMSNKGPHGTVWVPKCAEFRCEQLWFSRPKLIFQNFWHFFCEKGFSKLGNMG